MLRVIIDLGPAAFRWFSGGVRYWCNGVILLQRVVGGHLWVVSVIHVLCSVLTRPKQLEVRLYP